MTPTFTVLIGSIGRPVLKDTLDSIQRQRRVPGDQCIVAIDAFEHGDRPDVQALVQSYGEGFIACAYDSGYHWLGVEQINYALRTVPITGSHVFTMGDDDVFVDGAYATLRPLCAADPTRPILYRFLTPENAHGGRLILWDKPQLAINHISGCCIAAPVACVSAMTTERIVTHDYVWIADIVRRSQQVPLWLPQTLVIARPDRRGDGVAHRGVWTCWHCRAWQYREDVPIAKTRCACGAVIDLPGTAVPLQVPA